MEPYLGPLVDLYELLLDQSDRRAGMWETELHSASTRKNAHSHRRTSSRTIIEKAPTSPCSEGPIWVVRLQSHPNLKKKFEMIAR